MKKTGKELLKSIGGDHNADLVFQKALRSEPEIDWNQIANSMSIDKDAAEGYYKYLCSLSNRKKRGNWTKQEDETIIKMFKGKSKLSEMASALPGRTAYGINHRISLLGLRSQFNDPQIDVFLLQSVDRVGPKYGLISNAIPGSTPYNLDCRTKTLRKSQKRRFYCDENDDTSNEIEENI